MTHSRFFIALHELRQDFPLSSFLFFLIAKVIKKLLSEARRDGAFKGIKVIEHGSLSHLLFLADILCFSQGSERDLLVLKYVLNLYCKATCTVLNLDKSCIYYNSIPDLIKIVLKTILPYQKRDPVVNFKYLGFLLKLDNYHFVNWLWLVKKVEGHVSF